MQPEDAPPPRPRVLPRRGRRGPAGRFRLIIFGVIAAGIFLLMSLRGLAGFYTDFLWFDSLGQLIPQRLIKAVNHTLFCSPYA